MSLGFFADHCVANSVVGALREAGHEVFVLREHIACDSDDTVFGDSAYTVSAPEANPRRTMFEMRDSRAEPSRP